MSRAEIAQHLCQLCHRIFRGCWLRREESVISDSESLNDGKNDSHFYERPDWLQIDSIVDLGIVRTSDPTPSSPVHHSIPALEVSANAGCHLCVVIWDQLQSKLPDVRRSWGNNLDRAIGVVVARRSLDSLGDQEPQSSPEPVNLEILYFINGTCEIAEAYVTNIDIHLQPAADYPGHVGTVQSSTTKPTSSLVRQIREWASTCIETHPECNIHDPPWTDVRQGRRLPTRLLDVDIDQGDAFVRLREGHTIDQNADYITLSHCWGLSLPARLLQGSYQQFCRQIPISTLPRTFQDAIQSVRDLHKRFLWIDAMCIVQDSKDDWLQESVHMASIYSSSWLNIAATSSVDGHGGLFRPRNNLLSAPCHVDTSWTGHPPGPYICLDQSAWARRVEKGILNTRGWVLQERLLAPRTVHFAHDQIWWECRAERNCEAFPDGVPEYVFDFNTIKARLLTGLDPKDPLGSNELWLEIVKAYTQTHLTKDSDRLIALAGITSTIQTSLNWPGDDYHAGLWKYDLPVDLLWRMAAQGTRVQEYVAPSWSWASVKGEVYFNSSENSARIREHTVVEIQMVLTSATGGPLGPVASGSIHIRGSLHAICLSDVHDSANDRYMTKLQIGVSTTFSGDEFAEILDDEVLYARGPLHACFCPFATFETSHLDKRYSSEGLVLDVVDPDRAVYQRIGWMRLFHDEHDGPFRNPLAGGNRDSRFSII